MTVTRILFALSGFHRYHRGAEIALLAVAQRLSARQDCDVTVLGSGPPIDGTTYSYRQIPTVDRTWFEKLPAVPFFRNETAWEDAIFAFNLSRKYDPRQFDCIITCAFPFSHFALRSRRASAPVQLFVTQNGDWPAFAQGAEYRFFDCDGLICTNPEYFERNRKRWNCALIPNGVDLERFSPDPRPPSTMAPTILMVSALIDSKRVAEAITAVARIDGARLVVAGDGPLRAKIDDLAKSLLPGRFERLTVPGDRMPELYRSADVFLHMSKSESFGNVYVEALASGLPVVAHDSANVRWIFGDVATLCDTDDPEALDRALNSALRRKATYKPPELERFSWDTIALQYLDFIRKTCARKANDLAA